MGICQLLHVLASGPSCEELLQLFGSNTKAGPKINASIDEANFLRDVVQLHKNPTSAIRWPIVVEYMGQPAVDVGGVRRHFFTDIMNRVTSASELQLFEGPKQAVHVLPVANSQYLMSSLFRIHYQWRSMFLTPGTILVLVLCH